MERDQIKRLTAEELSAKLDEFSVYVEIYASLRDEAKNRIQCGQSVPGYAVTTAYRREWKSDGEAFEAAIKADLFIVEPMSLATIEKRYNLTPVQRDLFEAATVMLAVDRLVRVRG